MTIDIFRDGTDQQPFDGVQTGGANHNQVIVVILQEVLGNDRLGVAEPHVDRDVGEPVLFFQLIRNIL